MDIPATRITNKSCYDSVLDCSWLLMDETWPFLNVTFVGSYILSFANNKKNEGGGAVAEWCKALLEREKKQKKDIRFANRHGQT